MGNTLAPVQRDLSLVDSDSASDAKEILDCLKDMARDRIVVFYEKIGHCDGDKNLIPINEAVKEFSAGAVADGLSSAATNTITKLLD